MSKSFNPDEKLRIYYILEELNKKNTDLHYVIELLDDLPIDQVNYRNECGITALNSASYYGYIEIVKILLTFPNIDINIKYWPNGTTALISAIRKGHIEIAKILLTYASTNSNFDINIQDDVGFTALITASMYGHTEIVKILLTFPNIDINIECNNDCAALFRASWGGHIEIVELLLNHAATNNKININARSNSSSYTILMCASRNGHTKIVKKLLTIPDIDINIQNHKGNTALDKAKKHNYTEIINLLENYNN